MNTTPKIEVENLGPIADLAFTMERPGVTVLTAPNGAGKSILLDSLATAAGGKGKLPLRDNAKRGSLAAFGARVTIGSKTTHKGEFEAVHLEGRFDLAELVDPGMKSDVAADARRIKALIHLLEVRADPDLFRNDPAFGDFHAIVKPASLEADDPVEMARRVKADYDEHARIEEANAEQAIGMARAAEDAAGDIDVTLPHDEVELRAAYNAARDEWQRKTAERKAWVDLREKAVAAQDRLTAASQTVDLAGAQTAHEVAAEEDRVRRAAVDELTGQLDAANAAATAASNRLESAAATLQSVESAAGIISAARAEVAAFNDQAETTAEHVASAEEASNVAAAVMDQGTRIRSALTHKQTADGHRAKAKASRALAEQLRASAAATDDVLSRAINCPALAVRMVAGQQRLVVTDHRRREDVGQLPYSELSHGERWRVAIDLAADQVGKGGLVVVKQEAWEGLDSEARAAIHEHATERGVYVLTAEASQDGDRTMRTGAYAAK